MRGTNCCSLPCASRTVRPPGHCRNGVKLPLPRRRRNGTSRRCSSPPRCGGIPIMDVATYMHGVGRQARAASRILARADAEIRNRALTEMARAIERDSKRLLEANARDLAEAKKKKLDNAMIDRLTLTPKVIEAMADGLRQIVALPDSIGEIVNLKERPSGIKVGQM